MLIKKTTHRFHGLKEIFSVFSVTKKLEEKMKTGGKMKKKLFIAVILGLLLTTAVFANPGDIVWDANHDLGGMEEGYSVLQTDDGNFVVAGLMYIAIDPNVMLMKTTSTGQFNWSQIYGENYEVETAYSIIQTDDGGFITAGHKQSVEGGQDFLVIKTDSDGTLEWQYRYEVIFDQVGYTILATDDGGYLIAGNSNHDNIQRFDIHLLKIDSEGIEEWTQNYGGMMGEYGRDIIQTQDGNYVIAGMTQSFGAGLSDGYLVKIDADGNLLWEQAYGGTDDDIFETVTEAANGDLIAGGATYTYGAGGSDSYIVRTDADGNFLWESYFGYPQFEFVNSIIATPDDGILAAGVTGMSYTDLDIYVIKTDSEGTLVWDRVYDHSPHLTANEIIPTFSGNYLLTGTINMSGNLNMYMAEIEDGDPGDPGYIEGNVTLNGTGNVEDVVITGGGELTSPDASGNYTLEVLPGIYDITASLGGYASQTNYGVVVIEGATTSDIDFDLGYVTGNLYGTVTLSGGYGNVVDVLIEAEDTAGNLFTGNPNSLGDYSIAVIPGYYDVTYSLDGYIPQTIEEVQVPVGTGPYGVNITLVAQVGTEDNFVNAIFSLDQNYPNPFNPTTSISFSVSQTSSFVNLDIYNLKGQHIKRLVREQLSAGRHSIVWNGTDDNNQPVSSGMYLYKLKNGNYTSTRKMILMK